MPSRSTRSSVAWMPAVSTRVRGTPSSTSSLSSRSRVVPGRSVTIARSWRLRRFSRVDLPTLGRPTIATRKPSRRRWPCSASRTRASSSVRTAVKALITASGCREGRSSSKSSRASSSASWSSKRSRNAVMRRCKPPSRPAIASWAALCPRAAIISAIASARVRSSRPLRNALWLNSPGAASRAPASSTAFSTRRTATRPPWQCNSTTSSRVKLRGARISSSRASSSRSPLFGSTTWP